MWQEVRSDIFEINILIYGKSYHEDDCLIYLLIISASRTISCYYFPFILLQPMVPHFSSLNWSYYRTVNYLQELSKRRRKKSCSTGIQSINGYLIITDYSVQQTWVMSDNMDGYNYKNVLCALGTYHLDAEIRVNHINQLGNDNNNNKGTYFEPLEC